MKYNKKREVDPESLTLKERIEAADKENIEKKKKEDAVAKKKVEEEAKPRFARWSPHYNSKK